MNEKSGTEKESAQTRKKSKQKSGKQLTDFVVGLVTFIIFILFITAAPLKVRDINWEHLSTTITRMDAGVEPPWMVSRRVVVGCSRFMSRIKVKQDLACYISHYG